MKKVILVQLAALFAAVVMMSCGGGNASSTQTKDLGPKETQEKFVGYVIDGKWDKAVDMLSDADKATPEQKAEFAELLKTLSQEMTGGVKSYEAIEETYSKDSTTCKVKGRYTYGNGTSKEATDKLKKTEKGWACTL